MAAPGPSPSGPGPTVPGAGLLWGPTAPCWGVSVGTGQCPQGDHRRLQGQPPPPAPFICSAGCYTDSDSFPSHRLEVMGSTLWEGSLATSLIKTYGWATHRATPTRCPGDPRPGRTRGAEPRPGGGCRGPAWG